jgi:hypothetical protein
VAGSDVDLPASVSVGSTNFTIARDRNNPLPRGYTFSGLDVTGKWRCSAGGGALSFERSVQPAHSPYD